MLFHQLALLTLCLFTTIQKQSSDAKPDAKNGELYLKNLLNNGKVGDNPEYLFFTAPYKICRGGCTEGNDTNIAIAFPLSIGNRGRSAFKQMYPNEKLYTKSTTPIYKTGLIKQLTANMNTQSTWFMRNILVAAITPSPSIPTLSTGYPGYTTPKLDASVEHNRYKYVDCNTSVKHDTREDHERLRKMKNLLKKKNKKLKSLRKIMIRILSDISPSSLNKLARRYGLKTLQPAFVIRRTISRKYSYPVKSLWLRFLPRVTKPQGSNNVDLRNRKPNALPQYGSTHAFPNTSKTSSKERLANYQSHNKLPKLIDRYNHFHLFEDMIV